MLLRIFNNKNRFLQFLLIAISSISIFIFPISIAPSVGFNPLYDIVINLIGDNQFTIRIVFILLISIPILLTHYFASMFGIIQRKNFHFLFLAPIFILSNPKAWSINPVLFALLLFVIGISNLFQLNRNENPIVISSTAFIFSIASLFYSMFIWNILLIIIALFIFREFKIRELLMVLGSYILPYIYLFTWYFVDDILFLKWKEFTSQLLNFSIDISLYNNYLQIAYTVLTAALVSYLLISLSSSLRNKLIQIREYIVFMLITLFISTIQLIFAGDNTLYHIILIQFLIAFFYSVQLSDKKPNWYNDIVILLLIIHNIISVLYA